MRSVCSFFSWENKNVLRDSFGKYFLIVKKLFSSISLISNGEQQDAVLGCTFSSWSKLVVWSHRLERLWGSGLDQFLRERGNKPEKSSIAVWCIHRPDSISVCFLMALKSLKTTFTVWLQFLPSLLEPEMDAVVVAVGNS